MVSTRAGMPDSLLAQDSPDLLHHSVGSDPPFFVDEKHPSSFILPSSVSVLMDLMQKLLDSTPRPLPPRRGGKISFIVFFSRSCLKTCR
jgi:hypothetical protein